MMKIEFVKNIAIKTQQTDGDINKKDVWKEENTVSEKYSNKTQQTDENTNQTDVWNDENTLKWWSNKNMRIPIKRCGSHENNLPEIFKLLIK